MLNICGTFKTRKMKKLIRLSDFVLEMFSQNAPPDDIILIMAQNFQSSGRYAKFLQQPVKLEMFLPCFENGKMMPTPKDFKDALNDSMTGAIAYKNFMEVDLPKAREKILFKNCYLWDVDTIMIGDVFVCWTGAFKDLTIEDLIKYNLELTENALEQFQKVIEPEYEHK